MKSCKYIPCFMNNILFKILTAGILSLVVVAVMWVPPLGNVEQGVPLKVFTNTLDARIPWLMKAYGIPGANIALVKGGQVVWMGAYGYADLKTKKKMTVDAYLRVQSLSKPVTAWGVMKLAEQGKIDLDCPIDQYIKNWVFPPSSFSADRVTVRQLLSHCAGLPLGDIFNMYSPQEKMPSLQENLTKEAVLISEPGSRFSYSNTGYNLLELLIQEVTGRDFAEYMEQEVLLPLGMEHASFKWSEQFWLRVPFGYDLSGRAIPIYVYPERGSGGLFAPIGDIAAFVAAGMPGSDQQVLSPRSVETLYTPAAKDLGLYRLVFDSYGLGYYLQDLSDGNRAVAHGGQGTGWMTHLHAVPETGDRVFMPRRKHWHPLRLLQGGLSTALMTGLLWCVNQKYLFISSVFPISAVWLGISVFVFALFLLLSALFPSYDQRTWSPGRVHSI